MKLIKAIGLSMVLLNGLNICAADKKLQGMDKDTVYHMGFFGPFSIAGYDAMMAAYKQSRFPQSGVESEPKITEEKKTEGSSISEKQLKEQLEKNATAIFEQRALARLGLDVPMYRYDQHTESMAAIRRYQAAKKQLTEYRAKFE